MKVIFMVPDNNIHRNYGFTKLPNDWFGRFKPSTTYVGLAVQSHAWMPDGARPSIARLMKLTGLKRTAVKSAIRELVAAGELAVTRRGDAMPNLYEFPKLTKDSSFTRFQNEWWKLNLDPRQAITLVALAHFDTMEHGALPGRRELARMTKINADRLLREVIPSLVATGILDVTQRSHGGARLSNAYRIVPLQEIELQAIFSQLEDDPEVASSATPRGLVGDPRGLQRDPLVASYATGGGPESDHEEDSLKKTEPEEDSLNKTDRTSPRLRRANEGEPEGEPESFGQELSGPKATQRHRNTDSGPQVQPGVTADLTLADRNFLADLEPTTKKENNAVMTDNDLGGAEKPAEPLDDTKADHDADDVPTGQLEGNADDHKKTPEWAVAMQIAKNRFPSLDRSRSPRARALLEEHAEEEYRRGQTFARSIDQRPRLRLVQ